MANYLYEKELKNSKDSKIFSTDKSKQKTSNKVKTEINRSFLLVMLLRLQQCCCHLNLLQKVAKNEIFSTDNEKEQEMFEQMESLSLCEDPKSTNSESSPFHGLFQGLNKNFISNTLQIENENLDDNFKSNASSTKILFILEELKKIRNNSKDGIMEKCVLVSQWVSMLEIVAEHVKRAGFRYNIIKGDINVETRMKIVENFNTDPQGAEIMLLSLKAGGVGLNLIGGNHLFILDIHWNPALESQACDRIYRLGQKKKVFIHKFICKDTIEEKIVALQNSKMNLANNVLSTNNTNQITLKDFYNLFQI